MPRGKPVSTEKREEIASMLEQGGLSQAEIAQETGVSETFVHRLKRTVLGEKAESDGKQPEKKAEPKDQRPKTPPPKDLGIAGGIETVYGLAGLAVQLRSPAAGSSMQVIAPYVGESWEKALKRHEKIFAALAPLLAVAEDVDDVLPGLMIPFLASTAERYVQNGMQPPPQLMLMLRGMMLPALKSLAKRQKESAQAAADMASLEAETGINLDSLLMSFFRAPPEGGAVPPSVDGGGPEAPPPDTGPYIPIEDDASVGA